MRSWGHYGLLSRRRRVLTPITAGRTHARRRRFLRHSNFGRVTLTDEDSAHSAPRRPACSCDAVPRISILTRWLRIGAACTAIGTCSCTPRATAVVRVYTPVDGAAPVHRTRRIGSAADTSGAPAVPRAFVPRVGCVTPRRAAACAPTTYGRARGASTPCESRSGGGRGAWGRAWVAGVGVSADSGGSGGNPEDTPVRAVISRRPADTMA